MRLAKMQDEKDLVPYQQAAPEAQAIQREKGIGEQFGDMAKKRAMGGVLDAGTEALTQGVASAFTPTIASGVEGGAVLGAGTGAGTGAGMAALGTAMPYVGAGLMGAKLLGLFSHGGHIGPLSPQYNSKGAKPDYIDIDNDNNTKEPMKEAAKSKKGPLYKAEGSGQITPTDMLFNRITDLFAEASALEQQGETDLAFNKRDEAGRLQEQYETIRAGMSRLGPEFVSNPINADDNIIMQGIKGLFNIPDYISAAKNRSEKAAALMNDDPIAMKKYGGIADVERQKNPLEM